MSVEIIQVSKLTVTIYPRSHKHIKSPEAAMTIHNTPDDLMGPPSLNPPSWIHGPANTHMQRDEMRAQWTVIFDLAVHRSLSALLRKKKQKLKYAFQVRSGLYGLQAEHIVFPSNMFFTCSPYYTHQQLLKQGYTGITETFLIFSNFTIETLGPYRHWKDWTMPVIYPMGWIWCKPAVTMKS